jgi:outer membrane lipoprotein-sorting protein
MAVQNTIHRARGIPSRKRPVVESVLLYLSHAFVPVLAVLITYGCATTKLEPVDKTDLPAKTVAPHELIDHINLTGGRIEGIKGTLNLGYQKEPGQPTKHCRGLLATKRSGDGYTSPLLYLKGYKRLLPTFFTLVSDGLGFWFYVPRRNIVYTGSVEAVDRENNKHDIDLKASDLFKAVYIYPIDRDAVWEVEETEQIYIVSVFDTIGDGSNVKRRLWLDRRLLTVDREIYYFGEGDLEVLRTNYFESEAFLYPKTITIRNNKAGRAVFLDFDKVTINPENIMEDMFHFVMPAGVEIKHVE